MRVVRLVLVASASIAVGSLASAWAQQPSTAIAPQAPPGGTSPEAAAIRPFDVKAAVDAYLAKVPPDKRARSDAYFEGGYWLQLWDFLYGTALALLLLARGWSARMRNVAERVTRFRPVHTIVYWAQYVVLTTLLAFPLTVYEAFFREHQYGLSTQGFGAWLGDQLMGLLVGLILGGLLMTGLFATTRAVGRSWWIWGAAVCTLFLGFVLLVSPVYIAPLFNTYKKLEDPRIKDPILAMARANGIDVSDVYEFDASRQSTRVSANVSGFLGTQRVSLNDNLLKRCSPDEIQAVMGHEIGHYVLNHVYKLFFFFGVLLFATFAYLRGTLEWALGRWGARWDVKGIGDVAVVPLVMLLVSIFFFVATPMVNTVVRTEEYEADIFGLNASRQPDGEAEVDLKLGEYRKLDPGPLEEFLFFDHPSGRTRITAAMRWKAEHLP